MDIYFRFDSKLQAWRNQLLFAKCLNEEYITYLDRLLAIPDTLMLPESPVYFQVDERVPAHPDVYATGGPTNLYSERLTDLIIGQGISCEIIPVKMLGREQDVLLPINYNIIYLNEIYPAVDLERTKNHDFGLENLILTSAFLKEGRQFFRPKEYPYIILIHKDFRSILEKNDITGCEYLNLKNLREGIWD